MTYRQVFILLFLVYVISVTGKSGKKRKTWTSPELIDHTLKPNLNIYKELSEEGKNVFFSPASITIAMAMTYMGARKNTEKQMKKVLGFQKFKNKLLHKLIKNLRLELVKGGEKGKNYTLNYATRLFGQKDYKFKKGFLKDTGNYYAAKLQPVDFSVEGEHERINAWVSKRTNEKIPALFTEPIDPKTRLVLVNALYFSGQWAETFDPEKTEVSKFTKSDGTEVDVDMMHIAKKYENAYLVKYKCDIIQIPYKGELLSMVIILPRENNALDAEQEADAIFQTVQMLKKKEQYFYKKHLEVYIPKFRLEESFSLVDMYKKFGITDAFNAGKADFSGMDGSKNLYLSSITHKSFIEVNEEGSEAAAATAVKTNLRSAIKTFTADHPFMFFIQDSRSGALLFMGKVENPTP